MEARGGLQTTGWSAYKTKTVNNLVSNRKHANFMGRKVQVEQAFVVKKRL